VHPLDADDVGPAPEPLDAGVGADVDVDVGVGATVGAGEGLPMVVVPPSSSVTTMTPPSPPHGVPAVTPTLEMAVSAASAVGVKIAAACGSPFSFARKNAVA
jgi:hypothetical protein